MMKELQESFDIKDNPNTLNIVILLKKTPSGDQGEGSSPLPQLEDKEGFNKLIQMAGM